MAPTPSVPHLPSLTGPLHQSSSPHLPWPPSPPTDSYRWTPRQSEDADTIARNLDDESRLLFQKVTFSDVVQHAFGFTPEAVDRFLFFNHLVAARLLRFTSLYPAKREIYLQVITV